MPDIEAVRRFAGADGAGPDPALEMCLQAAVRWYEGAGVPADLQGADYDFWVANLAAWMYDNRGNADAQAAIPAYIVTSVHQLRAKAAAAAKAKDAAQCLKDALKKGLITEEEIRQALGTSDGGEG